MQNSQNMLWEVTLQEGGVGAQNDKYRVLRQKGGQASLFWCQPSCGALG